MLFLRWYFWVAPNLLVGVGAVNFFRRRLHKEFPVFALYVVFLLLQFIVFVTIDLLIVASITSLEMYRWVLLLATFIAAAFQLAVIYEMAKHLVLSRSSSLAGPLRSIVRWSLALLLLAAAASSALFPQTGLDHVTAIFQVLDFSSSLLAIGLLITLLVFSQALHISWRSLPAGIALGLGIFASAEISGSALYSVLGRPGYISIDFIRMGAFHVCVLIWLIYLFLPERAPSRTGEHLPEPDLEFWNQELERMVKR